MCFGDRHGYGNDVCGVSGKEPCLAPTQVLYRSVDEGRMWKYQGTLFNPAENPTSANAEAASESAIVQLADGKTLFNVLRFDGDCGCHTTGSLTDRVGGGECGKYTYYHQSFSTSMGATWSKHTPMPGKGCVKPRLLMLGGSGNSTTDSERTFMEKRTRNLFVTKDHH